MEEGKALFKEVVSEDYDAADRPFDFVEEGDATALVCESDPTLREKISGILKELGYRITESTTAKDALKAMRFHVFDVVVLNELFDATDPQANSVLLYLEEMLMTTRRRFFVALLSARFRTMDNMAAFNRSVRWEVRVPAWRRISRRRSRRNGSPVSSSPLFKTSTAPRRSPMTMYMLLIV